MKLHVLSFLRDQLCSGQLARALLETTLERTERYDEDIEYDNLRRITGYPN